MKFNFSSFFLPGVITTTTNALDYEVASDVILYVKVCDSQGAPNCLSATALVYVSVTDVNEYAPQFLQVHPLYIRDSIMLSTSYWQCQTQTNEIVNLNDLFLNVGAYRLCGLL